MVFSFVAFDLCLYILAMDYEGVYRKTGGSSDTKAITYLFERGNCEAIDLSNCDLYIDISSVTSVLKTYFRMLPNPLLTYALHEAFVGAANLRDPLSKAQSLSSLVFQLPSEHFHTLRYLMLHLHRYVTGQLFFFGNSCLPQDTTAICGKLDERAESGGRFRT